MDKNAKVQKSKRVRRAPVDWSKVPVVIEGTPNPEAVRLLWASVREFEISQRVKQALQEQKSTDVVVRGSISSS